MSIKVSPIHVNKWHFYMNKFNTCKSNSSNASNTEIKICNDEALKFNWFSCGKPYTDKYGTQVLQIDRYSSFFNKTSGKSYHVTFDSTELKPCTLKVLMTIKGKNSMDKEFNSALNDDYNGIAIHVNNGTNDMKCDLICDEIDMIFDQNVLEESKLCPYINYAKTHAYVLRQEFKNFPSDEELSKSKPGKMSIKLRNILCPYFTS